MAIREETVWEALKQVRDPEIGIDLVNLGLIYEILITEHEGKSDIHVKMTLTSPACPSGPQMIQEVKDVLRQLGDEVGQVNVEVVLSPPWTPDRMSEEARDELGFY
ncbi:MAG: metal-sulfur cluster assembly factor [Thermogutta sp.]|nr:metal-sulfur cluster assembly factor [Thermogutta sp.]HOP78278.1 metal-sulfur cluster assembly factor [Thermogutta sp.]HPU05774.1 metal-sulfur cluster assembly factor [Thermogutta sp.]HPZ84583.1 metal-sulfur cluster assembly factor [Thermogutta sp.]HQF13982.1 metal-sulfur cluster assembly factor [Thermogutta sp.]